MWQLQSIRDTINLIRRRFFLIATIIVLGCAASVYFALNQPLLYEATAVIQIETPQVAENLTRPNASTSTENRIKLIEQKLMSRDSLVAIIEKFDLYSDMADVGLNLKVFELRKAARIVALTDPAQSWRPDIHPSGLIISVRLGDAQQSADVANEFLENVLVEARARREGLASRTFDFFESEEKRLSEVLAKAEAEFALFKKENANSLPEALSAQRDQLTSLREPQLDIEQELILLETNKSRMRADEYARQSELLNQQNKLILGRMAEIQSAIDASPDVERRFNAMERQLGQLQAELTQIATRRAEAATSSLLESQNQYERFEVLETALAPEFPVSKSRKKIALAGGVISLIAAFGIALSIEIMNPTIRSGAQLERELGVQPVIVIPYLHGQNAQLKRRLILITVLTIVLIGLPALLRVRAETFFAALRQKPVQTAL